MKIVNYIFICLALTLNACNEIKEVPSLDFDVHTDSETVKVGEEIKFFFKGDPGMISFYSGEQGNDYAYKDKPRIDEIDEISLSFRTHNQEAAPLPTMSLAKVKVMFSTDFNGTYEYSSIKEEEWTDITYLFTMASPRAWGSGLGWFDSGLANITDLKVEGKPFYIAFKYEVPPYAGTTNQTRRWRVDSYKLNTKTSLGKIETSGYTPAAFSLISRDEPRITLSQLASTIILFAPRAHTAQESVEEWVISSPYSADEINLGYEFAEAIKGYGDPRMDEYKHIYQEAGTYTVTFVGTNANINANKQVVKQLTITVLP